MRKLSILGVMLGVSLLVLPPKGMGEQLDQYGVPEINKSEATLDETSAEDFLNNEANLTTEEATATEEVAEEADEVVPAPAAVEVGGAAATRTVEERLADFDEVNNDGWLKEVSLYRAPEFQYGWRLRGELLSQQNEGKSKKRDEAQVGKVQVIPYLIVRNLTPRLDFRVHATLNFEGTLNKQLDKQDSDKKEDSANDHGIVLRPDKDLIEAVRAALEINLGSMGETPAVIVIEAGKGKILVGDMPNANFFDYSALEVFNIDQTGFISVGVDAGDKLFLRFEVFNLEDSEKGNFGKSLNLAGEWVFEANADGEATRRLYVAGTHNEPDFANSNAVTTLSVDQNQYTVGAEAKAVPFVGNVNAQYVYRDNQNGKVRDDQGFALTLDRDLNELVVGLLGMLSYEYLDTRDTLLGKHQVRLGSRYYPQWFVPAPTDDTDQEDLQPQRAWYLQAEWGHGSNGNKPIGSTSDERDMGKLGLGLNW